MRSTNVFIVISYEFCSCLVFACSAFAWFLQFSPNDVYLFVEPIELRSLGRSRLFSVSLINNTYLVNSLRGWFIDPNAWIQKSQIELIKNATTSTTQSSLSSVAQIKNRISPVLWNFVFNSAIKWSNRVVYYNNNSRIVHICSTTKLFVELTIDFTNKGIHVRKFCKLG